MSQDISNPCFEGAEKRVEVHFKGAADLGLRQLSRQSVDAILEDAVCTVVSTLSNESLDSYVLSESSLFVYPDRFILKTCGTTRLLNAVPRLLSEAAQLGLYPCWVKFSRASYLFPRQQVRQLLDCLSGYVQWPPCVVPCANCNYLWWHLLVIVWELTWLTLATVLYDSAPGWPVVVRAQVNDSWCQSPALAVRAQKSVIQRLASRWDAIQGVQRGEH